MNNRKFIIPIFVSHLGCPNDCVFCNQRKITGIDTELTGEDVSNIIAQYFVTIPQDAQDVEVAFYGGSFTGITMSKQLELLMAIKNSQYHARIKNVRLSTRPDYIDYDKVKFLKSNGVTIIELGVQSLIQEVLDSSHRGHTIEDVYKAAKIIKNENIILGLQIMIGLPEDDLLRTIKTATGIVDLRPSFARIYPALVIKDTELERKFLEGMYRPLELNEAVNHSKIALSILEASGIKVIRLGLQTTECINLGKDVVAGPFHEAFRELVEGEIAFDLVINYLSNRVLEKDLKGKIVSLTCNPKYTSVLAGHKRTNIHRLKEGFPNVTFKILNRKEICYGDVEIAYSNIIANISRSEIITQINHRAREYINKSLL